MEVTNIFSPSVFWSKVEAFDWQEWLLQWQTQSFSLSPSRGSNPQGPTTNQPSPSGKICGKANCCYPLVRRVTERFERTGRSIPKKTTSKDDNGPWWSSWKAFKNTMMCGLETAIFMAKIKLLWIFAKSSKGVIWNVWDVGSDLWKAADHFM